MSQDLDGGKRATVFVVAVGAYKNLAPRRRVEEAAQSLVDLFGASTHVRLEQPMIGGPKAGDLLQRIKNWGKHITPSESTGLLLWTGHADLDKFDNPRLHAYDDPVTPEEIGQALLTLEESGIREWVVVLDCCYGHRIGVPIYERLDRLVGQLPDSRLAMITAVDSLDEADAGVFTSAFADILRLGPEEGWWSLSDDFVEWDVFVKRLYEVLDDGPLPRTSGITGRIIPNPLYRPKGVAAGSFDEEHFLPKARGIEAGESGWYFTGRVDVLHELIGWLHTEGSGFHIVTGSAGTGKSAILGRLITLSVEDYRDMAPEEILAEAPVPDLGDIQLAFHARERRVEELLRFLAEGLGAAEYRDVSDLYEPLATSTAKRRGRPYVIAVDALDEATGEHGRRMFNEVLLKVGARPGIKVLIGSRPGVVDWARTGVPDESIVDLDGEPHTRGDIALYVARRLRRVSGSPYAGWDPDDARLDEIAAAVADASISIAPDGTEVGSFLVARVVSKTLAGSPVIDTTASGWKERLPRGLEAAFEEDLASYGARHDAETEQLIRNLLEGLAWDEGQGIPRRHIPLFAWAATDRTYEDDAVTTLLRLAGGHIIETEQGGWAMYRLYHERFREYLRDTTRERRGGEAPS